MEILPTERKQCSKNSFIKKVDKIITHLKLNSNEFLKVTTTDSV